MLDMAPGQYFWDRNGTMTWSHKRAECCRAWYRPICEAKFLGHRHYSQRSTARAKLARPYRQQQSDCQLAGYETADSDSEGDETLCLRVSFWLAPDPLSGWSKQGFELSLYFQLKFLCPEKSVILWQVVSQTSSCGDGRQLFIIKRAIRTR